MRRRKRHDGIANGPALVACAALALVLMILLLLARFGTADGGIRVVIRATARTSFALFILAFVAAPLRRAWRGDVTTWIVARRRYLGLSFAVSHLLHLLAILALYAWSPRRFVAETGTAAVIGGGIGYVLVALMAATSSDRAVAWLGPRRWRRLHTFGMYYLWTIFTASYVPRAVVGSAAYAPLALLAIAALALRLRYRPRPTTPAAAAT